MTPKEKAKELMCKFTKIIPPSSYVAYEEGVQINFDLENAKQCALIAVDEIISELEDIMNFTGNKLSLKLIKYWKEVKIEIEKL